MFLSMYMRVDAACKERNAEMIKETHQDFVTMCSYLDILRKTKNIDKGKSHQQIFPVTGQYMQMVLDMLKYIHVTTTAKSACHL